MGLLDVKTVDSTANVINKVDVTSPDLEVITILLFIIVALLAANICFKLYRMHNRCLKKKYTASRGNDLDKI